MYVWLGLKRNSEAEITGRPLYSRERVFEVTGS